MLKKLFWLQIMGKQLGHLVSEAQWVRVEYKVSSKHIAPSPILWQQICVVQLWEEVNRKKRFLSGIARIRGGLPMPKFFGPLFRSAFLVNKKSLFLQKC